MRVGNVILLLSLCLLQSTKIPTYDVKEEVNWQYKAPEGGTGLGLLLLYPEIGPSSSSR